MAVTVILAYHLFLLLSFVNLPYLKCEVQNLPVPSLRIFLDPVSLELGLSRSKAAVGWRIKGLTQEEGSWQVMFRDDGRIFIVS